MMRGQRAFTLVELIAALGITALIGYFFVSIGRDFVTAWDGVGDSVARETEARAALDTIARDFEAAFFLEGDDVMFAVDTLNDNSNAGIKWEDGLAERPDSSGFDPTNHEYGWAGCWVRFFTAAPSLNAVGYQIIRSTIISGDSRPRYMLYRNVVDMQDTLAISKINKFNITNIAYAPNGYLVGLERPDILAINVVDFGVRLYVYENDSGNLDPSGDDAPDGLRLIFPADSESTLESPIPSGGLIHRASTFAETPYGIRYPDVVEFFLRVLDGRGADELLKVEESGVNAQWDAVVEKHSRLYRRFVVVRGNGGS